MTNARVAAESAHRAGVNAASSTLKQIGSFLRRDGAELIVEVMGAQGLGWEGEAFSAEEIAHIRNLYYSKAGGIAGGSQEIQYNIIAKRILGLPDPTSAT